MIPVLAAAFVAVASWAAGHALEARAARVVALAVPPRPGAGAAGTVPGRPAHGDGTSEGTLAIRARRWARTLGSAVAGRLRPAARGESLLAQLTDALAAIASASRAGRSLPQAIEVAAEQSPEPLGRELRSLVERVRLGTPIEDALERWASSLPTPEVRLTVGVLRMHRAVGGAVAPALENLARTLRERRSAARELRSLTAQARLSGAILGLLPVGFFAFLWVTSRQDMIAALGMPLGRGAIALGLLLDAAAFAWIRRLLRVGG